MKKDKALNLQKGDEVIIKATGKVATVLRAYKKNGEAFVETTYNGYTEFHAKEIS